MKSLSLLLLLLLLAGPVLAQDSIRLKMVKHHRVALNGQCVIDASYPEATGFPALTAKIKALLPQPCDPADVEPGQVFKIEQDFKVTYNSKGLLSVYGTGLEMLTEKGQMIGAHPSKLMSGIILDINTGKAYSLRDLFGADAYAKLDDLLAKGAAKEAGSTEVMPLEGHTYHCYLSEKGVTFYQIFDNFAAGSLEVTIPYAEAVKLANPQGPLARFGVK